MLKKILIALVLFCAVVPAAEAEASYNHIATCKGTLRGIASDDDIHALGVYTKATSFGGWGTYWHDVRGEAYVYGKFNYAGGVTHWYLGHCWGGDYGPDSF